MVIRLKLEDSIGVCRAENGENSLGGGSHMGWYRRAAVAKRVCFLEPATQRPAGSF